MTTLSPETCERALRLLVEVIADHPNRRTAVHHVAGLLGVSSEALRILQRKAEGVAGEPPGVASEAAEEIKRLKCEVAELRRANEILKAASKLFANELDRPTTR